jgi:hypothetical protein
MRRLAMFAALLIVAGCQAADAPTPQIIYVTAPPSPGSPSMASIPSPATATPAASDVESHNEAETHPDSTSDSQAGVTELRDAVLQRHRVLELQHPGPSGSHVLGRAG